MTQFISNQKIDLRQTSLFDKKVYKLNVPQNCKKAAPEGRNVVGVVYDIVTGAYEKRNVVGVI
ncbi:MAG: hypothetical protein H7843_09080 [Nitrospirota bacterium]